MTSNNNSKMLLRREQWQRECRSDLTAWATRALRPYGQKPARHHAYLLEELEAVARGEVDRLMIFMPPGHAKTRYASILFPAWMLAQGTGIDMIGASYNAEYAEGISLEITQLIREHHETLGYNLVTGNRKLWITTKRGRYRAAGAGSGITGRRADLVIIDDPIKGREDADSPTIREKVWAWYRAEVITRLKPGARIILINTRWHYDDLSGRLLQAQEAGADQWRIINLPAIAEGEDDTLGRVPGEALWPEWENEQALERKRISVGPREWASLYQQRPALDEAALFRVGMLSMVDAAPATITQTVRSWDLAATEKKVSDYTVGVKLGKTAIGSYVVLDVLRLRGGPDEILATIYNTAKLDGPRCHVRLPEDPGQAGKHQTLHMTRALAGFAVTTERESGDKVSRASPVASQVNIGNVALLRAYWNEAFREELAMFPLAAHDDQVDAFAGAFAVLGLGRPGIHVAPGAGRRMSEPDRSLRR